MFWRPNKTKSTQNVLTCRMRYGFSAPTSVGANPAKGCFFRTKLLVDELYTASGMQRRKTSVKLYPNTSLQRTLEEWMCLLANCITAHFERASRRTARPEYRSVISINKTFCRKSRNFDRNWSSWGAKPCNRPCDAWIWPWQCWLFFCRISAGESPCCTRYKLQVHCPLFRFQLSASIRSSRSPNDLAPNPRHLSGGCGPTNLLRWPFST